MGRLRARRAAHGRVRGVVWRNSMALPEGLDSPYFAKIAFYMDTIDQLIDFEELKRLFIEQARQNAFDNASENFAVKEAVDAALQEILKFEDWQFWNYIITNMMIFWSLKKNIGPNSSDECFHSCHHSMYSYDIARRMRDAMTGKPSEPLFSENDLDS
jgi:hypothetical protein